MSSKLSLTLNEFIALKVLNNNYTHKQANKLLTDLHTNKLFYAELYNLMDKKIFSIDKKIVNEKNHTFKASLSKKQWNFLNVLFNTEEID